AAMSAGSTSTPVTSWPSVCRRPPTRPGPQPASRTRAPRGAIASTSLASPSRSSPRVAIARNRSMYHWEWFGSSATIRIHALCSGAMRPAYGGRPAASDRLDSTHPEAAAQPVVPLGARGVQPGDLDDLALALVLGADRVQGSHGRGVPDVGVAEVDPDVLGIVRVVELGVQVVARGEEELAGDPVDRGDDAPFVLDQLTMGLGEVRDPPGEEGHGDEHADEDRTSTRLNATHVSIAE